MLFDDMHRIRCKVKEMGVLEVRYALARIREKKVITEYEYYLEQEYIKELSYQKLS